jgi:hypothetical protein
LTSRKTKTRRLYTLLQELSKEAEEHPEKLVQETLPLAGTPHVEAVAEMAKYNPFFEKAGIQKVAESKPSKSVTEALAKLEALGFDSP